MAKITRKHQNIFAAMAPYIAQWGSMAASSKASSTDVETIQALAAWAAGFDGALNADGVLAIEDLDAFFYVITSQLAYLLQTGIPEWNSVIEYYTGGYVNNGNDSIFMGASDTNSDDALTDGTKWVNTISRHVTVVSSLDYTVLNVDKFIVCPLTPTAENHHIILPTPSAGNAGREIKVKQTAIISGQTLSVSVANNSTIDGASTNGVSQWTCKKFICDGTNWHSA